MSPVESGVHVELLLLSLFLKKYLLDIFSNPVTLFIIFDVHKLNSNLAAICVSVGFD